MSYEAPTEILNQFPHTCYYPQVRLVTWHPRGVLDDQLSERIVAFLEMEERIAEEPFDRYTDLTGITEIRLKIGHAFEIAERRRSGYRGPPVKSAFYSDRIASYGISRMYEVLMEAASIRVRTFRAREAAAIWLGVPAEILLPPAEHQLPEP